MVSDWWDFGLDTITFWFVGVLLWLCPYTKVEESFNTQATHDILTFGVKQSALPSYDHFEFPGVVPRTFVGPIILSIIVKPISLILRLSKPNQLFAARLVLGGISSLSLGQFRRSFFASTLGGQGSRYRFYSSVFTALVCCCQFHLPFYMSRPLANTFALALMNLALSSWMKDRGGECVSFLACACSIFRADCILLAAPLLLSSLLLGRFQWGSVLRMGVISSVVSVSTTIAIDSYFWQQFPKWPEMEVFMYNTYMNKSHNWGTEPFAWYFYSALPRALLGGFILVPISLLRTPPRIGLLLGHQPLQLLKLDQHRCRIFLPVLLFVLLYSFLPHKELRFIFPALPVLNALATLPLAALLAFPFLRTAADDAGGGVGYCRRMIRSGIVEACCAAVLLIVSALCAWLIFLAASSVNYPGGDALAELHRRLPPCRGDIKDGGRGGGEQLTPPPYIHIANIAAINGVTRFGQEETCYRYSKEEHITDPRDFEKFDVLLSEKETPPTESFELWFLQEGFAGMDFTKLRVKTKPVVYIHKRKNDSKSF